MKGKIAQFFLLAIFVVACGNETNKITSSADSSAVQHDNNTLQDSIPSAQQHAEALPPADKQGETIFTGKTPATLSALFNGYEKEAQTFFIPADKDTIITCVEGTSIAIKAKSFMIEKTGAEPVENILVSIKEYYKLSDILLAGLSTTSNDKLLETAGMIYITASSGDEKCVLKKGETFEIEFPSKTDKKDMQLFNGNWKDVNKMDWVPDKRSKNVNAVFLVAEEMPTLLNGESMTSYVKKSMVYPAKAAEKGIIGTVYVTFIVSRSGKIRNVKLLKGIDPDCDQAALNMVKAMPRLRPAKVRGRGVDVQFTLPVRFTVNDAGTSAVTEKKIPVKNDVVLADDDDDEKDTIGDLASYLFASSQLEWINCDRFQNYPAKINYLVDLKNGDDLFLDVIFHQFKSISQGLRNSSAFLFKNVPENEKITLVAIKLLNKKLYLAIKETTTSSVMEQNLVFQEVTPEVLKNEIKKLDKFKSW